MIDRMSDTTIVARDILDRRLKTRDAVLTTVLWVIYAYLWLPFISLIAWLVGIDFAYGLVEQAGGLSHLVELLTSFAIALAFITCIVIGWSALQFWRFHDKERRSTSPLPNYDDEMSLWDIDAAGLYQIRCGHRLTIALDEHGAITSVRDADQTPGPIPTRPLAAPSPAD
jgi:poly-beta-1,6-N-acetyl-D-glucosamine biosynthesis protein PgaD